MSDTAILLVDDDKTILDALKQQIRQLFGLGLACETAENVREAREVLEELMEEDGTRVILVVSDWLMPDIKGDAFLAEVRERYPNITRVMLTGQADAAALKRIHDEQLVHALLFKPWEPEELHAAVRHAVEEG